MLEKHFKRLGHQKEGLGLGLSNLVVPRKGTETARKAFSCQVVKSYNRFPPELKNENLVVRSKKRCNDFDFNF